MFSDREKVGVAYLTEPAFTEVENHETHSDHPYPRRGDKMRGNLSRQNHGDDRWILFNLVHERDGQGLKTHITKGSGSPFCSSFS